MDTNKIIFDINTVVESNTKWELTGSGPDFVTYTLGRGIEFAIFVEEDGKIHSSMLGEFDNFEEFKTSF